MEVSFRLVDTTVSLRINRLSQTQPRNLAEDDVVRRAVKEENIRKVLAEREQRIVKAIMNRGIF